jgi:DNA/RNA-binding domain of Phe-tRNA-synthetase-like protein
MSLQAHTQGLQVVVEESLRGILALGILEAEHVQTGELPAHFLAERDRVVERLTTLYADRQTGDIPGAAETRALFHRLDIDPTKHRPSSEALLRRVLQGKGLPEVNAVVDVCNLCSLEHQLPFGLYDRAVVQGPVHVRVGRDGEGYPGIRKQRVHLGGRLLLADQVGAFGAPTSDSERTSVTPETTGLLLVAFGPAERGGDQMIAALEHVSGLLTSCCGANVTAVRVLQ